MEKTKKNYSERWTLEEERGLIKARIKLDYAFQSKNCNPRQCWEKVTKEAKLGKGFRNVTQKWQNILKKYKRMIQPQSGVSTEEGELLPTQWELFDELHDFLKTRHGLHPTYIIDAEINDSSGLSCSSSICISSDSPGPSSSNNSHCVTINSSVENMECSESDCVELLVPEKAVKKNTNTQMIEIIKETSEEVRKSVRNIEKLVEFAAKQMFPNAQLPDLE